MGKRAALFDLYGTLLYMTVEDARWMALKMSRVIREAGGYEFDDEKLWEVSVRLWDDYSSGLYKNSREYNAAILKVMGIEPTERLLESLDPLEDLQRTLVHLTPNAEETLRALKEMGVKIGVLSNSPAETAKADLKHSGLHKLLDAVVISSEVGVKKPDVKIFQIILRELGVEASEALHVGDSLEDVVGAKRAGIPVCLYTPEEGAKIYRTRDILGDVRAEAEFATPDCMIKDLKEVLRLFGGPPP